MLMHNRTSNLVAGCQVIQLLPQTLASRSYEFSAYTAPGLLHEVE
jgi:hypothetical protein